MKTIKLQLVLVYCIITLFIPFIGMSQQIIDSHQDKFTKDYFISAAYYPVNYKTTKHYKSWIISSFNNNIYFSWTCNLSFQGNTHTGDKLLILLSDGTTLTLYASENNTAAYNKESDQTVQNTTYYNSSFLTPATSKSTATNIQGSSWYEGIGKYRISYNDLQILASNLTVSVRAYCGKEQYFDPMGEKDPKLWGKEIKILAKKFKKEFDKRKITNNF